MRALRRVNRRRTPADPPLRRRRRRLSLAPSPHAHTSAIALRAHTDAALGAAVTRSTALCSGTSDRAVHRALSGLHICLAALSSARAPRPHKPPSVRVPVAHHGGPATPRQADYDPTDRALMRSTGEREKREGGKNAPTPQPRPFALTLLFSHSQNLIFRFLQSRTRVQIWLFEQTDLRIEGQIIVRVWGWIWGWRGLPARETQRAIEARARSIHRHLTLSISFPLSPRAAPGLRRVHEPGPGRGGRGVR